MDDTKSSPVRNSSALVEEFRAYLLRENLKCTRQREAIVGVFARMEGHASVEDLLKQVSRTEKGIGYATVYRTLKLLVESGLASVRHFGDGESRYEVRSPEHHDHLICTECGLVIEFKLPEVEKLQEEVASKAGFHLESHCHELYGVCQEVAAGRPCRYNPEAGKDSLGGRPFSDQGSVPASFERRSAESLPSAFRKYLAREQLKSTRQRDLIVEVFSKLEGHVSVDDLLAEVKRRDPQIGYATVYRTLKLLVDSGLAASRSFEGGRTRYETRGLEHHDHMICQRTGKIIEFRSDEIEELQENLARKLGFKLLRHRHELYGYLEGTPPPEN